MAEFQEVARHWKRMCKMYWTPLSCNGCPIAECEGFEACCDSGFDVEKMEKLVMEWNTEHPEPVYPTWKEYLEEQEIVQLVCFSKAQSATSSSSESSYIHAVKTMPNFYRPIPADTAQKLGIKPKGE